jgi:putative transposase
MITGLLNNAGWHVNHTRVERIWRREGLKVPQKQEKRTALAVRRVLRPPAVRTSQSCLVLRFRAGSDHDCRVFRTLNVIDEFTKEALVFRVKRKLYSTDVVDALTNLLILHGPPKIIRSDKGAEFVAEKVRA